MKRITKENAELLLKSTNGAIFSASFIKLDGSLRVINGRLGVRKGLKGKGLAFSPEVYDLLTVYDLKRKGWRMINLNSLRRVTVAGQTFKVV